MAFCSQCGTPVESSDSFCPNCGTPCRVPQQSTPQQPTYQQAVPQQPVYQQPTYQEPAFSGSASVGKAVKNVSNFAKVAKWLIPLVLVVAVVVTVLVFDPFKLFKDDETLIRERIQAYEDACNDGDYEAMLECMDSETQALMEGTMGIMDGLFSEGTGLDIGMSDMFGLAGAMGDYFTIEITDIEIDGDYATVTIIMTADMYGTSTSTEEAELPMVKEKGDWYIGGVENMLSDQLMGY